MLTRIDPGHPGRGCGTMWTITSDVSTTAALTWRATVSSSTMSRTSRITPLLCTAVACNLHDSAIPTRTEQNRGDTRCAWHVVGTDIIQRRIDLRELGVGR